jgi:hypothetical protein
MRKTFLFPILFLILFCLSTASGLAAGRVWIGLYLAGDKAPRHEAVLAPEKLRPRLHAVFGFKHYELLKEQEIEWAGDGEQWFVPRKDFFIRMQPLPRVPGEPRLMEYEIYKDGFSVAKGRFEPREGTPLFINGPDFHQGRLILMLDERKE